MKKYEARCDSDGNVIVKVIAVVIAIGTIKNHLKGQGGCCGGGSYKPKKKKLEQIIEKKEFHIEGMHCENCNQATPMIRYSSIPYHPLLPLY